MCICLLRWVFKGGIWYVPGKLHKIFELRRGITLGVRAGDGINLSKRVGFLGVNGVKTLETTDCKNMAEVGAIHKSISADLHYGCGNIHRLQRSAAEKGIVANLLQTFRELHAGQAGAFKKGTVTDCLDCVGQMDSGQLGGTHEAVFGNGGNGLAVNGGRHR